MSAAGTPGDAADGLSRGEVAAILEARARALARPLASGRRAEVLELVVFRLGAESYAVESRFVLEIFRGAEIAQIPGGAGPMTGIAACRGELLPLLDLHALLGLPPAEGEADRIVAVLGEARPAFAVSLDGVPHLVELEASEIRPLVVDAPRGQEWLRGTTAGALLVLDTEKLVHTHS